MNREKLELENLLEEELNNEHKKPFNIYIKSDKELREFLLSVKAGLVSSTWEKRIENLQKLRGIVKEVKPKPDEFLKVINNFNVELKSALTDLRSQVMREACLTIAYLSVEFGNKIELVIFPLLEDLSNLVTNSVKIMSVSAKVVFKSIFMNVKSNRLLLKLIYFINTSKSNILRQVCSEMLMIVCDNWSSKLIEKYSKDICEGVKKVITDSDEQTRAFGRQAYHLLDKQCPKLSKQIFESLDKNKQNMLLKDSTNSESLLKRSVSTISLENKENIRHTFSAKKPSTQILRSALKNSAVKTLKNNISSDRQLQNIQEINIPEEKSTVLLTILDNLKSGTFYKRLEGLENLEKYMKSSVLKENEVAALTNIFNDVCMENQSKVLIKYLTVLYVFIDLNYSLISSWLESLLKQMLNIQGGSSLKTVCDETDKNLKLILVKFEPNQVLKEFCKIISLFQGSMSLKTKTLTIQYLTTIVNENQKCLLDLPKPTLLSCLENILTWSNDSKSQELRTISANFIYQIFVPSSRFTSICLDSLSLTSKTRALCIINNEYSCKYTLKSCGDLKSPLKYTPKKQQISRIPSKQATDPSITNTSSFNSLVTSIDSGAFEEKPIDNFCDSRTPEVQTKKKDSIHLPKNKFISPETKLIDTFCDSNVLTESSNISLEQNEFESLKPKEPISENERRETEPSQIEKHISENETPEKAQIHISDSSILVESSQLPTNIALEHNEPEQNEVEQNLNEPNNIQHIDNIETLFSLINDVLINDDDIFQKKILIPLKHYLEICSPMELERQIISLRSLLMQLTTHKSATVRKQTIICLGKVCNVIGDKFCSSLEFPVFIVKLILHYSKNYDKSGGLRQNVPE